jgi:hypothetical protein
LADGHDALLVAFAEDAQGGAFGVEVFEAEFGEFGAADGGAVEGFQNGAVADA